MPRTPISWRSTCSVSGSEEPSLRCYRATHGEALRTGGCSIGRWIAERRDAIQDADPHLRDIAWNCENAVLAPGTAVSLAQHVLACT